MSCDHKFWLLAALAALTLGCGAAQRAAVAATKALSVREWPSCTASVANGSAALECGGSSLPCTAVGRGSLVGPGTDGTLWTCSIEQDGAPVAVALVVSSANDVAFATGASEYGAIGSVNVLDAVADEGGRIDEIVVEWVDETREWVLYRANATGEIVGAADVVTAEMGSCSWTVEPREGWPTRELAVRVQYDDEPTGAESSLTWSPSTGRFVGEPPACEAAEDGVALPPE